MASGSLTWVVFVRIGFSNKFLAAWWEAPVPPRRWLTRVRSKDATAATWLLERRKMNLALRGFTFSLPGERRRAKSGTSTSQVSFFVRWIGRKPDSGMVKFSRHDFTGSHLYTPCVSFTKFWYSQSSSVIDSPGEINGWKHGSWLASDRHGMTGFADWSKENQVAPRYDRNRKIHNNHIFKLLSRNERGFSAQRSAPSWLEPLAEVFESKQSSKNIRLTGLGRRSMLFHIPVRTWHHILWQMFCVAPDMMMMIIIIIVVALLTVRAIQYRTYLSKNFQLAKITSAFSVVKIVVRVYKKLTLVLQRFYKDSRLWFHQLNLDLWYQVAVEVVGTPKSDPFFLLVAHTILIAKTANLHF